MYVYNDNSGLYSIANSINRFVNIWKDEKIKRKEIEKAQAQLGIVKNLFSEQEVFPEAITDGWHLVKVTDNFRYCSDAKVLVNNNKIERFVIDDYAEFSLEFTTVSGIKNAKSTINLHLPNGNTEATEIYFIYDLNEPNLTSEPLEAGYVTFWSDLRNAKTIEVFIDRKRQGKLKKPLNMAKCFDNGGLTLKLKPGSYNFKAESRGPKSWSGNFQVRENQCYVYWLNKRNKD